MPTDPNAIIKPGDFINAPNGQLFYWSKSGKTFYEVDEGGTHRRMPHNMCIMMKRSVAEANLVTQKKLDAKEIAARLKAEATPSESAQPETSSSVE